MLRRSLVIAFVCLAFLGGCARMPGIGVTSIKAKNAAELERYLMTHKADVELFRLRGPFQVTVRNDFEFRPSGAQRIDADLYLSSPAEKAPLVILLHGQDNSKEHHAYQAMHLATWGMHSLVLQLPNRGPWLDNGKTLAGIVNSIYRGPEIIDSRIDVNKIILAGHSFGGAAVTIALAEGASAAGGILLDPAGTGKGLPGHLARITKPVIVLGADERVSATLARDSFYRYVRSGVAEVSIRNATHQDAEFPMEPASRTASTGPSTSTEALQITFVSALTSAAFSLGATGSFDYAWKSFGDSIENGKLLSPKKK